MQIRRARALFLSVALAAALAAPAARAETETVVSHGLSAFGELKYPADFTHFGYARPDAPRGGRIALRPSTARNTFDHFNETLLKGDAAARSLELLFDTLMARAFDEPDASYGLLAESVETPADRSFAIFRLRAEARFADGAPVTAEDVAWSLETLRDKAGPRVALQLRSLASATALDARTVRVDFDDSAPRRDMPARVGAMPIFSKKDFEGLDFAEPRAEPPLGSGPYRVGAFSQGRSVVYERREDYWAKDLPVRRGHYNFDKIELQYYLDTDVALLAFKDGEFDMIEEFKSANWATKYDIPEIADGRIVREVLPDERPSGAQGFWLNTRRAKFRDPRVRRAFDLAFDFEWSNQALFYNLYQRTHGIFQNSDLAAGEGAPPAAVAAVLGEIEGAPEGAFGEAYTPAASDGSGRNRRNLARASRLLTDAGWRLEDGVRVNADGVALEVEFLDRTSSGFDRIIEPYIRNLERLGVRARLREVDPAQYELRQKDFDYDIVTARFAWLATPGPELKGFFGSESAAAAGSFNLSGVSSPAVDALLERIEAARSREELRVATDALDRVLRAGHYWVPHWYKAAHHLAYWNRFGRPMDMGLPKPRYARGVISTWWVDEAKAAAIDAQR